MWSRRVFPLAVALILSASWQLPCAAQGDREIAGFVRSGQTNRPIDAVTVTLETSAGESIQQTSTQGSGYFSFSGIDSGIYYVRAKAMGYQERRERADLLSYRRVTVHMNLAPDKSEPSASGPTGVVNQRLLRIPEPARKEFEKGQHLLTAMKDPRASINAFKKAIERHSDFPEAYLLVGTAHMDLGEWKEAQQSLRKAVELDSKLAAAHFALGSASAQLGDLDGSEKALKAGLEIEPGSAVGHWEMARLCWTRKRMEDAETHTRVVLRIAPQLAPAHVMIGNLYLVKGDLASAAQAFGEYLRIEPQGPLAAATKETLRRIEAAQSKR